MKKILYFISFFLLSNFANAQFIGSCIKVLKIDYSLSISGQRSVVEKLIEQNDSLLIQTAKDGQKYKMTIDLKKAFGLKEFIKIGSRVTYEMTGKDKFIIIATMDNFGNVEVRRFKVCD
jgi:hypothetical protein